MEPGTGADAIRRLRNALGSLLALLGAAAALVALNLSGGLLARWLGLPPGGGPRLGWDLAWLVLAMGAAAALAAWLAPAAPRRHALGVLAAMELLAAAAVVQAGTDWPLWFNAVALLAPVGLMAACAAWRGPSGRG